jgi:8-oxo-dGTP diphosphatase
VTRPQVCVGAVIVDQGHILLVRRANPPQQGRWSLPGGRVELGETLVDAVRREVLEETGIHVAVGRFLEAVERIGPDHHFVILDYVATPIGPRSPTAGDDACDAKWIQMADLPRMDLSDGLAEFLGAHGIAP